MLIIKYNTVPEVQQKFCRALVERKLIKHEKEGIWKEGRRCNCNEGKYHHAKKSHLDPLQNAANRNPAKNHSVQ